MSASLASLASLVLDMDTYEQEVALAESLAADIHIQITLDCIEIAKDTGGNALELIYSTFCMYPYAFDQINALWASVA